MNTDINQLNEWFEVNRLSLNTNKTFYILFSKSNRLRKEDLYLTLGDNTIEQKHHTKFKGMIIDANCNWHNHISQIHNKISRSLYMLNHVKHILPIRHLRSLYYSLVHPHLEYGLVLWGSTHNSYVKKISTLQKKKTVRAINQIPYNNHTNDYFHKIKTLKLEDLFELQVAKYMYRLHNGQLTETLSSLLESYQWRQTHSYNTRNIPIPCSTYILHWSFHME